MQFQLHNVLLKPGVYLLGLWLGYGAVQAIDGLTHASTFSVEADPETLMHSETFPGVYQCDYIHTIQIGSAVARTSYTSWPPA
jgi:hypothetical protein